MGPRKIVVAKVTLEFNNSEIGITNCRFHFVKLNRLYEEARAVQYSAGRRDFSHRAKRYRADIYF